MMRVEMGRGLGEKGRGVGRESVHLLLPFPPPFKPVTQAMRGVRKKPDTQSIMKQYIINCTCIYYYVFFLSFNLNKTVI